MTERPSAEERVRRGEGVLSRGDLLTLGWQRRGVDTIFRECPVIGLPGYRRPFVRVRDYLELLERCSYSDRAGDRVRP